MTMEDLDIKLELSSTNSSTRIETTSRLHSLAFDLFRSRLSPSDLPRLDALLATESDPKLALDHLKIDVRTGIQRVVYQKYKFTARLRVILQSINSYASAGDILAQAGGPFTNVAWGGLRFVLLFAVQEGDTNEKLVEALEMVSGVLVRAGEYAAYWEHDNVLKKGTLELLEKDLVGLLAECAKFLWEAKRWYGKSVMGRYVTAGFKPWDRSLGASFERIKQLSVELNNDLLLIHSELLLLRSRLLSIHWLRPASFTSDYAKLRTSRTPSTCLWFLRNETVDTFLCSRASNVLYIHGAPGCGKSTLAAYLRSELLSSPIPGRYAIGILCKSGHEDKSDLLCILRNIVAELVQHSSQENSDYAQLHSLLQAARMESKTPYANSIPQLFELLKKMLSVLSQKIRFYVLVDGLDEASDPPEDVAPFIHRLSQLARPQFKILFISRHQPPVLENVSWNVYAITPSDVEPDIQTFATAAIEGSSRLRTHRQKDRIKDFLVSNANGMILWASLMFSEIESGHYNVDAAMKRPPTGLDTLYIGIIRRIAYQPNTVALLKCKNALALALSCPGLTISEFAAALAVMEGVQSWNDYEAGKDAERDCNEIITLLSPLLTILPDPGGVEAKWGRVGGRIQIFHASVRRFLLKSPALGKSAELEMFLFSKGELAKQMVETWLTYLSFSEFGDLPEEMAEKEIETQYPLLRYATFQLTRSVAELKGSCGEELRQRITDFLLNPAGYRWLSRISTKFHHGPEYQHLISLRLNTWVGTQPEAFRTKWKELRLDKLLITLNQRHLDTLAPPPRTNGTSPTQPQTSSSEEEIKTKSALARAYYLSGQSHLSLPLEESVLKSLTATLGPEHPDTLQASFNLALTLTSLGQYSRASTLAEELVHYRTSTLGDSDLGTLSALTVLVECYRHLSRLPEAERLAARVLFVRKKVLGDTHPSTLAAMGVMALVLRQQQRWGEAEELSVQIVNATSRTLGEEHPNTITAINGLSSVYFNQGRYEEARELSTRAVELAERMLGREHPTSLAAMNNLSTILSALGSVDLQLCFDCLDISKAVLGEEHPNTLVVQNNLFASLWQVGRLDEAEVIGQRVLEARRKVLGERSRDYLATKMNWCLVLQSRGQRREAEEGLRGVVRVAKEVGWEEGRVGGLWALVGVLGERGIGVRDGELEKELGEDEGYGGMEGEERDEAREVLEEVVEWRVRVLGEEHPSSVEAVERLEAWRRAGGAVI